MDANLIDPNAHVKRATCTFINGYVQIINNQIIRPYSVTWLN